MTQYIPTFIIILITTNVLPRIRILSPTFTQPYILTHIVTYILTNRVSDTYSDMHIEMFVDIYILFLYPDTQ